MFTDTHIHEEWLQAWLQDGASCVPGLFQGALRILTDGLLQQLGGAAPTLHFTAEELRP